MLQLKYPTDAALDDESSRFIDIFRLRVGAQREGMQSSKRDYVDLRTYVEEGLDGPRDRKDEAFAVAAKYDRLDHEARRAVHAALTRAFSF